MTRPETRPESAVECETCVPTQRVTLGPIHEHECAVAYKAVQSCMADDQRKNIGSCKQEWSAFRKCFGAAQTARQQTRQP